MDNDQEKLEINNLDKTIYNESIIKREYSEDPNQINQIIENSENKTKEKHLKNIEYIKENINNDMKIEMDEKHIKNIDIGFNNVENNMKIETD